MNNIFMITPGFVSEKILDSFLGYSLDLVCKVQSDGTILEINNSITQNLGYSSESLINSSIYTYIHLSDLERVRELFKQLMFGASSIRTEFKFKVYGGSYLFIDWCVSKLNDGVFLMIGRDITEKNKVLDELRQLAYVAKLTDDLILITDADGRVEWVNQGFEFTTGYSLDEIKGKKPGDVLQGKDTNPEDIKKIAIGLERRKPFRQEILNYTKKGLSYWVEMNIAPVFDEAGELVHFLSIEHDVTNQKKYEQLLESGLHDMQMFQLALDNASDIVVISDYDGQVIYANAAAELVTGYSLVEILGTKAGTLWGGLMEKEFYAEMWKTIKVEKKIFIGEIRNRKKNGIEYYSDIHISPVLNDAGEVSFFVAIERDITRQKEIDHMKSEFITLASHQLRTPLTAINWLLESLLQETVSFSEQQKKLISMISTSNMRMVEVVNSLLNVSRVESGKIKITPEIFDIKEFVQEIIDEIVLKEGRNQRVLLNVNLDQKEIPLDKGLSRVVFTKLISNALHFSADEAEIKVSIYIDNGLMVTEVEDHGVGIPEAQQRRVFERFYRAENIKLINTDGNGLSLYLVKLICDVIGGEIRFKSKEGVGTTFWYSLPADGMKARAGEVAVS